MHGQQNIRKKIKMDVTELGGSVDWIYLAQDRDKWRAVVKHSN